MPDSEAALAQERRLQKSADGEATLKDVRGYTDEELYSIARMGYFFFHQGKLEAARTIFQGLSINPVDAYFRQGAGRRRWPPAMPKVR